MKSFDGHFQIKILITARKRSLGQVNIFTPVCHSVHRGVPGQVPLPGPGTPHGQVHPPGPGASSGQVHPPWDQVHPRAGTPPQDQVHLHGTRYIPLETRYPPQAGTPPGTRYTPGTRYIPGMLGDTGNKRAVRILLECIVVRFFNIKSLPYLAFTIILYL